MTEGNWLRFVIEPRGHGRKTDRWEVIGKQRGEHLGDIKWFGAWRRYAFYPGPETVFEHVCLRDIATFCELQTKLHREARGQ